MLEVNNLSVTYPDGTIGLKNVSFHLEPGEKCALIGANGAGKTTLLMSLVGILPSEGTVTAEGIPLSAKTLSQLRQRVGVVFQNPDDQLFLPTVCANLAFGPENMGLDRAEIDRRIAETLAALGISQLKDRMAQRLSGGEKRLAALATVLVMEPEILLFDEPTAFLDPKARRRLIGVLSGLSQTCLVATHDLRFALETCERALVLREGELFAQGPSETLLFDQRLMEEGNVEAIERCAAT